PRRACCWSRRLRSACCGPALPPLPVRGSLPLRIRRGYRVIATPTPRAGPAPGHPRRPARPPERFADFLTARARPHAAVSCPLPSPRGSSMSIPLLDGAVTAVYPFVVHLATVLSPVGAIVLCTALLRFLLLPLTLAA